MFDESAKRDVRETFSPNAETGVSAAGYSGCNLCDGETDLAMTGPNIAIDYLVNRPELVDELARLS
jgi:hypothetical protein